MVASEMFLDTAQLRDSVVSHAKELNYLPRSFRSAQANVDIIITPSVTSNTVTIPARTSFTARMGSNSFNFTVPDTIVITENSNGVFYANDTAIYEGSYVTDTFIKDDSVPTQRFVLTNPNVDTTSLEVTVIEDSGANTATYVQSYSLFGLNSNSQVFFVQPSENEQYEIVFGDGFTGKQPKNGSVVAVEYRVGSGELPNGADTFVNNSNIDGHSNVSIILNESAHSGYITETINSIKFNAPRNFQTQERAVTTNDYKTLLQREFPEIRALSVYGGENVDPPQYGRVYIAIDNRSGLGTPDQTKAVYKSFLADKVPLSIETEFIAPSYIYLSVNSTVKYNYNATTLNPNQIRSKVISAIQNYNDVYLNDFNVQFLYSKFVTDIDNADPSIISNDTTVIPYSLLKPTLGFNSTFRISFDTKILITTPSDTAHGSGADRGVYSSLFTYNNLPCQFEDDGNGNMRIINVSSATHSELRKIGTINYETGEILINNVIIDSYLGSGIKLYVQPINNDISSTLKDIVKINLSDVTVTMTPIRK